MASTPTFQSIIARLPQDIVDLVGRISGDRDIDMDLREVKDMLPASPVVATIKYFLGLASEPQQSELDQADAWIDEQVDWQDRSVAVQNKLDDKFPFTREQAIKGEVPQWMSLPWASKLLFQWAESLQDAVLQAEEYVENL